jgi:uncharacterized membrane protein YfcA
MTEEKVSAATPAQIGASVDNSLRNTLTLVALGIVAGLLSGMFGVGGGTIIVPALVWIGFTQRHAAATSMLAIVPTSISGVFSYAWNGNVDWIAAGLLFVGMFAGGQVGSWLLSKLPERLLRWLFVAFLIFVIASQLIYVPSRSQEIHMSVTLGFGLVLFGVMVGILSGLLGIGGGAVAVPLLSLIFNASDLIARGTSLLAMFPNAITTSISNSRRKMVHVKSAVIIGFVAAGVAPAGTWIAGAISPKLGSVLFAVYLSMLLIRSLWAAMRHKD